ncbi:hypothetical protein [Baaleninema simplex]|uniref:hypothetical protein n=1 Tax=Baaleninema simplex TaxID=2862350 RepID=UPI00034AE6F2|nr:hypothetical protein [Baaleninema simplex]
MDEPKLTPAEMQHAQQLLHDYAPAREAMAVLEHHHGNVSTSVGELWEREVPPEQRSFDVSRESLWSVMRRVLRDEVCGDEGFLAKVTAYTRQPEDAALFTGVVIYLLELTMLPISPAIATIAVLYIVKVGLRVFCEYTEPGEG